jgi:hypothetical protein
MKVRLGQILLPFSILTGKLSRMQVYGDEIQEIGIFGDFFWKVKKECLRYILQNKRMIGG